MIDHVPDQANVILDFMQRLRFDWHCNGVHLCQIIHSTVIDKLVLFIPWTPFAGASSAGAAFIMAIFSLSAVSVL